MSGTNGDPSYRNKDWGSTDESNGERGRLVLERKMTGIEEMLLGGGCKYVPSPSTGKILSFFPQTISIGGLRTLSSQPVF